LDAQPDSLAYLAKQNLTLFADIFSARPQLGNWVSWIDPNRLVYSNCRP